MEAGVEGEGAGSVLLGAGLPPQAARLATMKAAMSIERMRLIFIRYVLLSLQKI